MDVFEFWMSFDRWERRVESREVGLEGEEQKGTGNWTCEGSVDGGWWLFSC